MVARARNGVIGRDGDLPWRLPSDLAHFKRVTLGKPCVMGRRTWESLPFALPGRANLVVSRQDGYAADGARVFGSLADAMGAAFAEAGKTGADEVMVIGGAGIYAQALPWTRRAYVTVVDAEPDGDTRMPELGVDWTCVERGGWERGPRDDHRFRTEVWERPG